MVTMDEAVKRHTVVTRHAKFECLRGREDCKPLCMIVSDCGGSYVCCGENTPASRYHANDEFNHCTMSEHYNDIVQIDERDIASVIHVLSGALHVQKCREAAKEQP